MPVIRVSDSIIVDTSFFVALSNKRDYHHVAAEALAQDFQDLIWLTTWPVVVEVCHMIPPASQLLFLQEYQQKSFEVFQLEDDDCEKLIKLLKKYKDHPIDLADLSLVLVAEHEGHGNILTFDKRDFSFLKWGNNRSFVNHCL